MIRRCQRRGRRVRAVASVVIHEVIQPELHAQIRDFEGMLAQVKRPRIEEHLPERLLVHLLRREERRRASTVDRVQRLDVPRPDRLERPIYSHVYAWRPQVR